MLDFEEEDDDEDEEAANGLSLNVEIPGKT
jgi:hypothetical protein